MENQLVLQVSHFLCGRHDKTSGNLSFCRLCGLVEVVLIVHKNGVHPFVNGQFIPTAVRNEKQNL